MDFSFKTKIGLDATDWQILIALQRDGRVSFSELARQVGLTPPAVSERVRKMEADSVIRGYHADVDPERLGYEITAIIRISVPTGAQCTTLLESLSEYPEVLEAHRVTGTESAVVKAVVGSSDHLQHLIDRMTALGKPTTSIATSYFIRVPKIDRMPGIQSFAQNGE